MSRVYTGEIGYLQLVKDVLNKGVDVKNERTGELCRTIFDAKFIVPEGEFFTVTHRPAPLRLAFEEFFFFLRGEMNTKKLEEKGCNFWVGNTTRDFLDRRGLGYLPEGHLGLAYSAQWRNFGGEYGIQEGCWDTPDYNRLDDYGVDQLYELTQGLRNDRYSRRHIVTLWNPMQSNHMALTPCWFGCKVSVLPNKDGVDILHMKIYNRSLDVCFGFLFAIQQYRLFQIALCKLFNFELGELVADMTDIHIYHNQLEYAKEIADRELGVNGRVEITKELNNLDDLLTMTWDDVRVRGLVVNKTKFKTNRPQMVA